MFGDPCPGTLKYLEVQYRCGPKGSQGKTFLFIIFLNFKQYKKLHNFHLDNFSFLKVNCVCVCEINEIIDYTVRIQLSPYIDTY